MGVFDLLVEGVASRLGVSPVALKMFRTARLFSGLQNSNLPAELVSLNAKQLARGVLNFALLQTLEDWVLPYWVNRQVDPGGTSFVPRSHTGVLMNVAHRTWTAVGNPDSSVEPIVDPRGMVTPFPDGWSLDTLLAVGDEVLFPSHQESMEQTLIDALPIVQTSCTFQGVHYRTTTWTEGSTLLHQLDLENRNERPLACRAAFSVRPFNPEGAALLHSVSWDPAREILRINGDNELKFSQPPDLVHCGNRLLGDAARTFAQANTAVARLSATCTRGLANGVAAFDLALPRGGAASIQCTCSLAESVPLLGRQNRTDRARSDWERRLASGTRVETPDNRLASILRSSLATLLMFCDGDTITPGPFTYHLFWFRDAAYMLAALDRMGHHEATRRIISSFPTHQERSGYFRSQKGEWDSNGQALWTIWHHATLTGDVALARGLRQSMQKGARWIEHARSTGGHHEGIAGLLPAGLSAEHLGVSDQYFWDNFWALGGIQAYARICDLLDEQNERKWADRLFWQYRSAVWGAMDTCRNRTGNRALTAGPSRGFDHGAIGSCSAFYPLQLFAEGDPVVRDTLDAITSTQSHKGLFFQHFIHSGMNPYLTLQVAHSYLFDGARRRFWDLLRAVLSVASPTLTFPEAIHPLSGGGSMGDGHHGWAAAEILLALRDAFVYERWSPNDQRHQLVLLGGMPVEWFAEGRASALHGAPVPDGTLSMEIESSRGVTRIRTVLEAVRERSRGAWEFRVPLRIAQAKVNGRAAPHAALHGETRVRVDGESSDCLEVLLRHDPAGGGRSAT